MDVKRVFFRTITKDPSSGRRFTDENRFFASRYRIIRGEKCIASRLNFFLESELTSKLDNAVRSAQNVVPLASLNQHFYTPQTVSSIFTGRATNLDILRHCLLTPGPTNRLHAQKRFVVYGLPGSGKTQFCCKFASGNKQR